MSDQTLHHSEVPEGRSPAHTVVAPQDSEGHVIDPIAAVGVRSSTGHHSNGARGRLRTRTCNCQRQRTVLTASSTVRRTSAQHEQDSTATGSRGHDVVGVNLQE